MIFSEIPSDDTPIGNLFDQFPSGGLVLSYFDEVKMDTKDGAEIVRMFNALQVTTPEMTLQEFADKCDQAHTFAVLHHLSLAYSKGVSILQEDERTIARSKSDVIAEGVVGLLFCIITAVLIYGAFNIASRIERILTFGGVAVFVMVGLQLGWMALKSMQRRKRIQEKFAFYAVK